MSDKRKNAGSNNAGSNNAGHPLTELCARVHEANRKWWLDLDTDKPLNRNVAEAMEGHRKNLPDDKLPHRQMIEVELADAVIRIFDICAGLGLDLAGAFDEKMAFNAIREDHTIEHRKSAHGKKY